MRRTSPGLRGPWQVLASLRGPQVFGGRWPSPSPLPTGRHEGCCQGPPTRVWPGPQIPPARPSGTPGPPNGPTALKAELFSSRCVRGHCTVLPRHFPAQSHPISWLSAIWEGERSNEGQASHTRIPDGRDGQSVLCPAPFGEPGCAAGQGPMPPLLQSPPTGGRQTSHTQTLLLKPRGLARPGGPGPARLDEVSCTEPTGTVGQRRPGCGMSERPPE